MSTKHDWIVWSGRPRRRLVSVWVSEQGAVWTEYVDHPRREVGRDDHVAALTQALMLFARRGILPEFKP